MLCITLLLGFAALGGTKAEVYNDLEPKQFYIRRIAKNPHVDTKEISGNGGQEQYLKILEDITEDVGLKISVQYKDPMKGDKTMQDLGLQDLCSALDQLADDSSSGSPRPDEVLGLKGKQCPLEKGLVKLPSYELPESLDLDYDLECDDYVSYVVYIESEDSFEYNRKPLLESRASSQRVCS